MTFSVNRVAALCLRYLYLLASSWPRLLELIYWPILNLLTWGFLQTYAMGSTNQTLFVGGALVSGLLLWEVLFRGQIGFSVSFLEEVWSRNLGNILMSPLRPIPPTKTRFASRTDRARTSSRHGCGSKRKRRCPSSGRRATEDTGSRPAPRACCRCTRIGNGSRPMHSGCRGRPRRNGRSVRC